MRAVIVKEGNIVKVEQIPRPSLRSPRDILLKVITAGLNPTDWKSASLTKKYDLVCGCDCVGEVVELGSEVPTDKVHRGQIRWAFIHGCKYSGRGAFAEYVNVEWEKSGLVPPNLTPQQAAGIPIPFATSVQALYLRLKLPQHPEKDESGKWILIWSGATSVGQYAIQLAKLSGLKVVTTASEKRWPLLKSLGADVIIDYKDPKVVEKLKGATNDSIEYGLDCISENGSLQIVQQAFRPSGGHLIAVLFNLGEQSRAEVKTEATIAYTVLGDDVSYYGSETYKTSPEDQELYAKWCAKSTEMFAKGELKTQEVEVIGGLEDVQKGFDIMKSGKHNSKLVYEV